MMTISEIERLRADLDAANRNAKEMHSLANRLQTENTELKRQAVERQHTTYQTRVGAWMMSCFGADITRNRDERGLRFFEEASELCQALGMTQDMALQMVTYTWSRDIGDPSQEVGGVMVTLAALCFAAGLDMTVDGETELTRINAPEIMDEIRRKHAAKVLRTPHSALPGSAA